jgi:hypothetical protein
MGDKSKADRRALDTRLHMLELREQLPPEPTARCTFCRKGSDEVYVVQLGSIFICEKCSDLLAAMVAEHRAGR